MKNESKNEILIKKNRSVILPFDAVATKLPLLDHFAFHTSSKLFFISY